MARSCSLDRNQSQSSFAQCVGLRQLIPPDYCCAFNFEYYHKYYKAVYSSTKSLRIRKMARNNCDVPATFLCKSYSVAV